MSLANLLRATPDARLNELTAWLEYCGLDVIWPSLVAESLPELSRGDAYALLIMLTGRGVLRMEYRVGEQVVERLDDDRFVDPDSGLTYAMEAVGVAFRRRAGAA